MKSRLTRRTFLKSVLAGGAVVASGGALISACGKGAERAHVFVVKVTRYEDDIASAIALGLKELGLVRKDIEGRRILLKPNLVEPSAEAPHVNTHPLVVRGAAEAFLRLGAASVLAAEGPGHCRDTFRVLDESGLADVLAPDRISFVDLNYEAGRLVPNKLRLTQLVRFTLPTLLDQVDWVVSMPKMKTHHWAGVTLSMKNLFGLLPGIYYGWPKNALHWAGIDKCILDLNATVRADFAIVDGIVGMEGDGPIMGDPRPAGVLVMGRNLPAVDATSCRIMGINPMSVPHLAASAGRLGPIGEEWIGQRGESIRSVMTEFRLEKEIPAHGRLRTFKPQD